MLIHIQRDRQQIKLNTDFASAVSEFAEVLQDPNLGAVMLAYVAYCTDLAEDNLFAHLPEDIRKKEVAESLKIENSKLKDPKVLAALKKYRVFTDNNVGYRFKEAYQSGMKVLSDYVSSKKKLNDDEAKKFADTMATMPALLKGKGEIEKAGVKEASKGVVRGQKQLTLNERVN